MNLRIDNTTFRIRINTDEVAELQKNSFLELHFPFTKNRLICKLVLDRDAQNSLRFEELDTVIQVVVHAQALEGLCARLPSRNGLEGTFTSSKGACQVFLEVDVRKPWYYSMD